MANFVITSPDGKKYKVSGESAEGAMAALKKHLSTGQADPRNADGTYGQPPEGMVMDPATNRMVDAKAIASEKFGSGAGKALMTGTRAATGIPVLGGLIERNAGMGDPVKQEIANQAFKQFDQENPKAALAAKIAGGVAGVAPLVVAAPAMMGASPAAGLAANSAWSAGSGAVMGGADAATRSGFDPKQIAIGTGAGAVTGGAAPAIGKLIGAGVNSVGGMLGIGNKSRSNAAIAEALRRSQMSPGDVADDVARAAADGQGVYIAADAMGNPGQRMLSGVARTPGDMRKEIVDTLLTRQSGQGGRLVNAMAEGFSAPNSALNPVDDAVGMFSPSRTASALRDNLTGVRKMSADGLYDAARKGAKPVNLSGAIDKIDDLLGRNPILGESALKSSEVGRRVAGLRDQLQKGGQQLIDFDSVLNVKQDLGNTIQNLRNSGKSVPPQLTSVMNALDDALEAASDGYRAANDTFARQSRVIDAIDTGATAQSGRVRSADSIPGFQGMSPDEQAAFRPGYADPLMARIESASSSPTTNKARMLLSEKTAAEFPAFAEPGRGRQLMDRIGREQRMFETSSQALGGSRTADNLADTAEMAGFDPTILGNLLQGRFGAATMNALQGVGDYARGRNDTTKDMIAKMLLENDPAKIRAVLSAAVQKSGGKEIGRQAIVKALLQSSGMQASGGGGY